MQVKLYIHNYARNVAYQMLKAVLQSLFKRLLDSTGAFRSWLDASMYYIYQTILFRTELGLETGYCNSVYVICNVCNNRSILV